MQRRVPWVLVGIMVLAVALRLPGLGFALEQDELYTLIDAIALFDSPSKPGIAARPFYYLFQHVLLGIGPATPVALRLPPLVFGLAGVWVTWLLGTRVFNPTAGWMAALLVAISPWHLHASGFARYWTLLYLLAAVFYLFLAAAWSSDRPAHYLAALGAALLGSVTHPTFLFAAAGAALGVTLSRPDGTLGWRWPSRRAWQLLWGPWAAGLVVGALALYVTGRGAAVQNFGGRGLSATLRLVPAMVQWMTPVVCAAGALGAGILAVQRARPEWRAFGRLSAAGGLVAVSALVVSATRTDVYADYGISMLPLVFACAGGLVALGVELLTAGRRTLAGVAATVLATGAAPSTASHLLDGTRFDYRPAFRAIPAADSGAVLAWPIVLARHYAPELRARELQLRRRFLDSTLAAAGEVWVVASVREYGIVGDDAGEGAPWLAAYCRLAGSTERMRFDSRRYRVELHRCRAET